jgi:hypothetical protein
MTPSVTHFNTLKRTGKRLTLLHFEKMIDKWARLLNIQRHQAERQGIPSDHVNGTEGGRREAP